MTTESERIAEALSADTFADWPFGPDVSVDPDLDPDLEEALTHEWAEANDEYAVLRVGPALKGRYVAGVDLNHPDRWHRITEVATADEDVDWEEHKLTHFRVPRGAVMLLHRDGYRLYAHTDRVATMSEGRARELIALDHEARMEAAEEHR